MSWISGNDVKKNFMSKWLQPSLISLCAIFNWKNADEKSNEVEIILTYAMFMLRDSKVHLKLLCIQTRLE